MFLRGKIMEKSELHITEIKREDKGRWVSSARSQKMTLGEWAINALNETAKRAIAEFAHPAWAKDLSKRSAHALVNAGYIGRREVRADFNRADFDVMQIPNLGRKGVDEVREWLL